MFFAHNVICYVFLSVCIRCSDSSPNPSFSSPFITTQITTGCGKKMNTLELKDTAKYEQKEIHATDPDEIRKYIYLYKDIPNMVIQSNDANTATESDMATTLNMRDIHSQVRNPNNLSSKQRQRRMVRRDSYDFFNKKVNKFTKKNGICKRIRYKSTCGYKHVYLVVADESDTINIISVVVDNNVKLECNEGMFTVDNDILHFTYKDNVFITFDVVMIENRLCDFKTQKYILIKGKDCTRQLTTKKNQSDLQ